MKPDAVSFFTNFQEQALNEVNTSSSDFLNSVFGIQGETSNPPDKTMQKLAEEGGMNKNQFDAAKKYIKKNFKGYELVEVKRDPDAKVVSLVIMNNKNVKLKIKYDCNNGCNLIEDLVKLREDANECGMKEEKFYNAIEYIQGQNKYKGLKIAKTRQDKESRVITFVLVDKNGQEKWWIRYVNGERTEEIDKTKTNSSSNTSSTSNKTKTTTNNNTASTGNAVSANKKAEMQKYVADCISKFDGGKIDIKDVGDIDSVARYTGISKDYIYKVLVGIEGKKNWPVTTAEYDNVPGKGHPKGHLTIGFGHTSLTGEPKVKEGMEITVKQAYQILANDIMTAIKGARSTIDMHLGKGSYDKLPKSIQDSIVDLVFNKGPGAAGETSLIANLQKKSYGAAALRTWYETDTPGIKKRNMYRFIHALSDIPQDSREYAVKKFKSEHYYDMIGRKKPYMEGVFEADINAQKDWNAMCEKYNLKSGEYKF